MMLFIGLVYAWSIFKDPFHQIFPAWTASDLSMTFTISMIFCGLGGFFGGQLIKKLKYRRLILIAVALVCTGFLAVSQLDINRSDSSLIALYLFYGVVCSVGVGICYNVIVSTVLKWFPEIYGLASGILLMSYGMGGLVFGNIVDALVSAVGMLPTFGWLALIVAVVLTGSALVISPPPTDSAPARENTQKTLPERRDFTTKQMLKTPVFWVAFFWFVVISAAGLAVINSAASITVAFGASAVSGLVVSVFNGGGRVLMGALFDRLGRKKTMYLDSILNILAGMVLLAAAFTGSIALVYIGLALSGIFFGGAPALAAAFANERFGSKHYAVNYSILNFCVIPASFIGPLVSGFLQNRSGGDYQSTFILMACLGVVALFLNLLLGVITGKKARKRVSLSDTL